VEKVQLQEVADKGKSFSFFNDATETPVTAKNVTAAIRGPSGIEAAAATSDVGSLLGAHTDISGMMQRGITLPTRPWYGYGIWGISHQAANATALELGLRTTLFSIPNTGLTPYVSSFLYGPYGGGAVFNPSLNRTLSGIDDN
jgi:hypothetical protein